MAENKLMHWLEEGRLILGDGAMGTMLQAAGLSSGAAPELWNIINPDKVQAIHQSYVNAGSKIIETNTFGGNSIRLRQHSLQDKIKEINKAGVRLAKEAAEPAGALVAGCIGPSGKLLKPFGDLTPEKAEEVFAEHAAILSESGADLLIIETMSDLREISAAIKGAQSVTDLPIAATMTFDTNYHTMMGVSPKKAVESISQMGVRIMGANCGNGPFEIEKVVAEMAQCRPKGAFLIAQSNAGRPKCKDGIIQYDGTPEIMAEYAIKMRALGVNIIGACCGSTPEHIGAMRVALEK